MQEERERECVCVLFEMSLVWRSMCVHVSVHVSEHATARPRLPVCVWEMRETESTTLGLRVITATGRALLSYYKHSYGSRRKEEPHLPWSALLE